MNTAQITDRVETNSYGLGTTLTKHFDIRNLSPDLKEGFLGICWYELKDAAKIMRNTCAVRDSSSDNNADDNVNAEANENANVNVNANANADDEFDFNFNF